MAGALQVEAFVTQHTGKVAFVGFGSMLSVYRENQHRLRLLRVRAHHAHPIIRPLHHLFHAWSCTISGSGVCSKELICSFQQAAVESCLVAGLAVVVSTSGARDFKNPDASKVGPYHASHMTCLDTHVAFTEVQRGARPRHHVSRMSLINTG